MEDLITFLIFVVIVIVNLVKAAMEKKSRKTPPPSSAETERPKPRSSTLETFFQDLTESFAPTSTSTPVWPEDHDRPDDLKEMEHFESTSSKQDSIRAQDIEKEMPVSRAIPIASLSTGADLPVPAPVVHDIHYIARSTTAIRSMPAMSVKTRGMRIQSFPLLQGSAAGIDLSLEKRSTLRQAMLTHLVFSPPRAYAVSFDNSVVS